MKSTTNRIWNAPVQAIDDQTLRNRLFFIFQLGHGKGPISQSISNQFNFYFFSHGMQKYNIPMAIH